MIYRLAHGLFYACAIISVYNIIHPLAAIGILAFSVGVLTERINQK